MGARAACPQRVLKYGMHLFGSASSLPAAYPEARYAQIEQWSNAK